MQQKNPTNAFRPKSLQLMIEMLKIDKNYKQAIKYGTNNYNINPYKINKVKLEQIPQLVNLIQVNYINLQKESSQQCDKKKSVWLSNQLKLFIWMSICHSYLTNKILEQYNQEDWSFFTTNLSRKNNDDLDYQIKSIFKNFHGNKEKWDQQQEEIIKLIIQQDISFILRDQKYLNRWNDVSRLLYFKSNKKYYRSAQKCRQHWFNHLDPKLNKNPWTIEQDIELIRQLQRSGFKWSKITQLMQNKSGYRRTQHMIKNRAKLLCKKYGYKDQKQQGCLKQLKMIQKKLQDEKQITIHSNLKHYEEQYLSQSKSNINELKSFDSKLLSSMNKNQASVSQQQLSQSKQSKIKKAQMNEKQVQNSNISESSSSQEQQQFQQTTKKPIQKQLFTTQNKKQSKQRNKRNVIILYHAEKNQKQSINNNNPDEEQSESIMIGQHVQNQIGEQIEREDVQKQESYYDQYQIIEQVHNQELDLNQQMQFNHEKHGGRMRERVTHQLAQFFTNGNKENQCQRNL